MIRRPGGLALRGEASVVLVDFLFDPSDPMLTGIDRLWELALLHQSLGVPTSEGMASSLQRGKGKKFHFAPRQLMSWGDI
jgi:hypothetical protein